MRSFAGTIFAVAFFSAEAIGNEEDVLAVRKVIITADGRKAFGEVSATVEAIPDAKSTRVAAIVLVVAGKKHEVPREQLQNLKDPLLETVRLLSGIEKGGEAVLYLEFRLYAEERASRSAMPVVRVLHKDGKLMGVTIRDPAK